MVEAEVAMEVGATATEEEVMATGEAATASATGAVGPAMEVEEDAPARRRPRSHPG